MTEETAADPLAEVGAVPGEDGLWTLVLVRELRHAPAVVWEALVDPDQLADWAPYTADRALGEPGPVTLTVIDGDTTVPTASTVTRVEAPSLLEHTWGTDLLRWELAPTATGTRLTLHHTVQAPDWLPKVAAGWHLCLVVAGRLLDGRPVPPVRGAYALDHGWQELHDAYAEVLRTG